MIGTIVFCRLTQKGPCGMTVNNDIDDDSATKHGDSHKIRLYFFWSEDWPALWSMVAAECDVAPISRGTTKSAAEHRLLVSAPANPSHSPNCARDQKLVPNIPRPRRLCSDGGFAYLPVPEC